jgi:imidazoleglycerol-phosphate dehydratase/histidinol-phosphatase
MTKRVLFIDRDGTLIEEPPDNQVDSLEKIRLLPGVIPALMEFREAGYRFVMVSNQDGLGSESFPTEIFQTCHQYVLTLFASQGIEFDEVHVCPHRAVDDCACRKPRAGLLTRYLAANALDLDRCAVIGDRDTDLQLAATIGIRGLLVAAGDAFNTSWQGICRTMLRSQRSATVERSTRETSIRADVNLDDCDPVNIDTGIGFYDHMLEQIARHGNFSLCLNCCGDLQVDEHHTVEDSAICIGSALREALGDKSGIGRYGFLLPMDESEAQVSVDLSGRSSFAFHGDFRRENVGGLPTELVAHFFQSFADALGAALHIRVQGENAHHMIEACFKAVGRALRPALQRTNLKGVPSTKGSLA